MEFKRNRMEAINAKLALGFQKITTNTFFREINVIGQENIPKDAPVIICGNHNNQFIDALLMGATAGRNVRFIMAAASMRRLVHGTFGRFLGCIPVERPRDLAKVGKGTIISIKDGVLKGKDTQFLSQIHKGTQIIMGIIKDQLRVTEVISDTELRFSLDTEENTFDNISEKYKICPDIDQSELFGYVWSALHRKQCIGIFPEGISHDSPDFMPIKAGVCIMALGAMQKYKQKVYIVPCGLNYFKGHRFRSKVTIQYGQAFEIPFELVDLYKNSRRDAISALLVEIETRLRSVVYTAQSFADLDSILLIKRLYINSFKNKLSNQEISILNNRFNSAHHNLAEHPEMKELLAQCKEQNTVMTRLKLTDEETIQRFKQGFFRTFIAIIYSVLHIVLSSLLAFPGLILNGPIGLVLRFLAENARKKEALGWPSPCLDIVASYKVSFGLVIIPITFWLYYLVFFFFLKNFVFSPDQIRLIYAIEVLFIVFYPIYAFLMLRLFDDIKANLKAIRARVRLFRQNETLQNREMSLQQKIRQMVDLYCTQHEENFDINRIIPLDDIAIHNSNMDDVNGQDMQADKTNLLASRRARFIMKLSKIRQSFSTPIKKIQAKLHSNKKIFSESTMLDIFRYLDKNRANTTSSGQETDD